MLGVELKSKTTILAVLIIAILGIGYFVAYPQWTKLSQIRSELERVKSENEKYNNQLSQMQTFLDQYKTYQDQISVASKTLPLKDMNLPEFVNNVADLAKMAGVVFSSLDITDESIGQETKVNAEYSIQNQDVSLTVSGTFPAIRNFVLLLENNLRLIDLQEISFNSKSNENIIESQIKLKTYYQK